MALTKTPIELSSTPGIVDNSNATAITIDSSENVTFAGTATAVGLTVTSSSSNAGTFKAVGGYAVQAYQDATSANHTALELRSDHVSGGTDRYLIRGYNTAAGTPVESFNVNTAGGATFSSDVAVTGSATLGTSSVGTNNIAPTALVLRHQSDQTSGFNDDFGVGMKFNADASNGGYATFAEILATQKGTGYQLRFKVGGSEKMALEGDNLLVGTTSSSNTSGSGVKISKPSYDGKIMVVGATSTNAQDGYQLYSTGASAFRFFVQYTGQINATASSINAISDVSLKENIRDLDKGLETILALQPRRFDWKNGDGNDIMGFVAQEVETVLPELVHDYKYNHEETKLGLKMGDMIPSLVKAIQEQQATIESQAAAITDLTTRLTALENN